MFVILLMGETCCGKSTFINSLANCLIHETLDEAAKNVKAAIRSIYHEYDSETGEKRTIELGPDDDNEGIDTIVSSTQCCKCHAFTDGKVIFESMVI